MADWQVGDLALCVNDCGPFKAPIKQGCVYTVAEVLAPGLSCQSPSVEQTGLRLRGVPDAPYVARGGYAAGRFRKINPLTDEERLQSLRDLDVPASPDLAEHKLMEVR